MQAIIDTSPLQALWRGGVLGLALRHFSKVAIPQSVADETRWSVELVGRRLVPDLDKLDVIRVQPVADDAVRAAMTALFQAYAARTFGKRRTAGPAPQVAVVRGKALAWTSKARRISFELPDVHVVVLAKAMDAVAVVDDRKALHAASDLGVPTLTTRELIDRLLPEDPGAAGSAVERIVATGYHPTRRAI